MDVPTAVDDVALSFGLSVRALAVLAGSSELGASGMSPWSPAVLDTLGHD